MDSWFEPEHSTGPTTPGPGNPIYDELAATLTQPAVVLDLFTRMKRLERDSGDWNGGDTVQVLGDWFSGFGIDVDGDEADAARSLRLPARLARALTAPALDEPSLIIHVRTDHPDPLGSTRVCLTALVRSLGDTSASVFDLAGDQIAHIAQPPTD